MATFVRWNRAPLDRAYEARRSTTPATYALPIDLYETETAFVLSANVPGLNPEQIQVNFEDGVLTISADHVQPQVDENARKLVQERAFGHFTRSLRLNDGIDTNGVEAVYNNGVLTLTLPKTPEAQPKQIPVKFSTPSLN